MRFFAALAAICALCQPALAQSPDCKSMTNSDARLACYDKTAAAPAPSATGRIEIAGSIAGLEIVTKILWYYLHERVWAAIKWGRRQH